MFLNPWLFLSAVSALVLVLGQRGYSRFPGAEKFMAVAVTVAAAILFAAAELELHRQPHFSLGLCVLAAGIIWQCYRYAEDESFKGIIQEIVARQNRG